MRFHTDWNAECEREAAGSTCHVHDEETAIVGIGVRSVPVIVAVPDNSTVVLASGVTLPITTEAVVSAVVFR